MAKHILTEEEYRSSPWFIQLKWGNRSEWELWTGTEFSRDYPKALEYATFSKALCMWDIPESKMTEKHPEARGVRAVQKVIFNILVMDPDPSIYMEDFWIGGSK